MWPVLKSRFQPKKLGRLRYRIGDTNILLPLDHALPEYQKAFRLYDRLPLYIGRAVISDWIVDIGANVGDTAAALVSGPAKSIVCIEPHGPFRELLQANQGALERNGSRIVIVPTAVAQVVSTVRIGGGSSTANRRISLRDEIVSAETLDLIISRVCKDDPVSMIKCDVDGFDGEALLSGKSAIQRWLPIILFECDLRFDQIESYLELFRFLNQCGYSFEAFDNFGMPLISLNNETQFNQLISYIVALHNNVSQRTFFYVDIFAFQPNSELAKEVLDSYYHFVKGLDCCLPRL